MVAIQNLAEPLLCQDSKVSKNGKKNKSLQTVAVDWELKWGSFKNKKIKLLDSPQTNTKSVHFQTFFIDD